MNEYDRNIVSLLSKLFREESLSLECLNTPARKVYEEEGENLSRWSVYTPRRERFMKKRGEISLAGVFKHHGERGL